jgi:hypothetical protein
VNAFFPAKLPKKAKRATRWRSQAHCNHVRSHACSKCGSTVNIEVAHVRLGSHAGIGQKPDDWQTVSLCGGPYGCHAKQHREGERTFWRGFPLADLIEEFIRTSPRRGEIEKARKERTNA